MSPWMNDEILKRTLRFCANEAATKPSTENCYNSPRNDSLSLDFSWSCMFCIAMRDSSRGIQLLTYSQPISIPSPCISIAFSKTSQDVINYGLDLTIDDAVRFYKPYAGDHDWCSILTGRFSSMFLILIQLLPLHFVLSSLA